MRSLFALTTKTAPIKLAITAIVASLLLLNGCERTDDTSSNNPGPSSIPIQGIFIVIDQFGYLPNSSKVAVIRDPQVGFDSHLSFNPSANFEVVSADTHEVVFSGTATPWNSGKTHSGSGDKVWWFDFSALHTAGQYYVRDAASGEKSYPFLIDNNVYKNVLKQAARAFFYQRAGFAKQQPFADEAWADGASHLGPLQDANARLYSAPNNPATERDLQGGWYDAGDYNKYTSWTANYVIGLLHAYSENPAAWGDDFGIPESNNGVADILDEIKWGLDWLTRMQNADGSVLSIVGLSHASPPSAAKGQSLYGPANTSATLTTAAAFALASKIFGEHENKNFGQYALNLRTRAESAWQWASNNPNVIFKNNDASHGSEGLGAGQQEVDEHERHMKKLTAAIYLFALTGNSTYQQYVETHYRTTELLKHNFASAFKAELIRTLLYYAHLEGTSEQVARTITNTFTKAINANNGWRALTNQRDPYRAYLADYTWGSSSIKAAKGSMLYEQIIYSLGTQSPQQVSNAALDYIHYLHGVNPLAKVYLSNMENYGAENSVTEFYHTWFSNGSKNWDSTKTSRYGPAPGFVIGGPNPAYNWDACCPNQCGNNNNNALCGVAPPSPPFNQPAQKSYADFNTSWPLNSWEVTENSNAYQTNYLRLLSKFVNNPNHK
ncbi:glycoside hydrolase family 9 protein [Saccharophagus degradans]|uniref:Glycoside hydrolase family 9 protein n=1 Tax=Saccharophagus degradans TaxID=86304 RepID=A0AAW7X6X2_9GAMM|nr:glycoside hydrolase family 9 protein [Saccharophagus degradans]MDO6422134.1 glycoside hydrolase family 9 protein [Saccharophagus degradans]MDO6607591.1 glycoside hydrolase family 9 protein [Saccharophagus degradans]